MKWFTKSESFAIIEIIKSKLISRRKALRLLGLTVAFGVATSVGVMTSASTAGAGADLSVALPALLSGITWPHTARPLLRRGHGARARQTQIFELLGAVSRLNEPHRSATQLSRAITDRVTTFGPAFYGPRR